MSITETVERGQRILEDRPEPKGRDRYAGRTNRPPRPPRNREEEGTETETETAEAEQAPATDGGDDDRPDARAEED